MSFVSPVASTSGPAPAVRASLLPVNLPWLDWLLLIAAGFFVFSPVTLTWKSNANYSFGWWIPLVAAFLFFERWPTRPARAPVERRVPPLAVFIAGGLLFLAFRLAAEADPDWRPGLWVLALLYLSGLLGWLRLYGGSDWLRHFAFPVCFLLLCLPWLYEIEHPLTQHLMRMNAILVAFSLQTLGVVADAQGNIIQLQNCQLGVEEACSGILSLQASLVMGLLLGEIYRLPLRRRIDLVLICLGAALVGNYLRTIFLALVASLQGGDAVTAWHDTAGFSILIVTALTGWLSCLALNVGQHDPAPVPVHDSAPVESRPARRLALAVIVMALGAELVTQGWFGWKELSVPRHPGWSVSFPAGSQDVPLPKLTLAALMCDEWKTATWQDARGWRWTNMWFNYEPKAYNRIVMGWHTPENCLPSVGWKKDQLYDEFVTTVNGIDLRVLPVRFLSGDQAIYVFWVVYPRSGSLPTHVDNRSHAPYAEKFGNHLRDVLEGDRGVGIETLETALAGPASYDEARQAYLQNLAALVRPSSNP